MSTVKNPPLTVCRPGHGKIGRLFQLLEDLWLIVYLCHYIFLASSFYLNKNNLYSGIKASIISLSDILFAGHGHPGQKEI